ncbi:hypothetical protein GMES_0910 [Paraglaciecola mesophila KMM 241]|uniref:Uncharacterized protein n=1 Tax=Paraglaciecola mesophila KMM 241 TaxID=1128912 RepID=K6ZIJ1_9ALTE|nr:hypothetical protein GMES_0910 [Paraglaciecola mesophila KMM 241]
MLKNDIMTPTVRLGENTIFKADIKTPNVNRLRKQSPILNLSIDVAAPLSISRCRITSSLRETLHD